MDQPFVIFVIAAFGLFGLILAWATWYTRQ